MHASSRRDVIASDKLVRHTPGNTALFQRRARRAEEQSRRGRRELWQPGDGQVLVVERCILQQYFIHLI